MELKPEQGRQVEQRWEPMVELELELGRNGLPEQVLPWKLQVGRQEQLAPHC